MNPVTPARKHFDGWLRSYGDAWEQRDSAAAVRLFSPGASYYWTPFDPPLVGHAAIAEALSAATASQRDIHFSYEILSADTGCGIAAWSAYFARLDTRAAVRVEGVLSAEWDDIGNCRRFREWWHLVEEAPAV